MISYYPNLLVSQVVHRNGVMDTQGNDPFSMRRPSSEGAAGSFASWSSGAYTYDGSGNITRIGTASYTYDAASRLIRHVLRRSHRRWNPEDAEPYVRFFREPDKHRRHQRPRHAHQQRHQSPQRCRDGL
jgi:hypothetical protein